MREPRCTKTTESSDALKLPNDLGLEGKGIDGSNWNTELQHKRSDYTWELELCSSVPWGFLLGSGLPHKR